MKKISFLLFAAFLLFSALAQTGRTVVVGYFPEPGMMNGAEPGAMKSGYAYEYLQEIASRAGWRYRYVYGRPEVKGQTEAGIHCLTSDFTPPTSLAGRRILLVEDNGLNREVAEYMLKDLGAEVETAEDGSAAVRLVREKGPDYYACILMDIQMPIMGGYEASELMVALAKFV